MRPAAHAYWHTFSEPLEGRVLHPYLCTAHKFTVGVGQAFFRAEDVAMLPWRRRLDGAMAGRGEAMAEFARLTDPETTCGVQLAKGQECPWRGVRTCLGHEGWTAAAKVATLTLTDEDVDRLVDEKLASNELRLRARWPSFADWPCDAQLALHSWAWAVGAASPYPMMSAALKMGDFQMAARECEINPKVGTIVKRNAANQRLLLNAAHVVALGLDRDALYYPRALSTQESPTLPQFPPSDSEPVVEGPVTEEDGGASRWAATRRDVLGRE